MNKDKINLLKNGSYHGVEAEYLTPGGADSGGVVAWEEAFLNGRLKT
jgi:hypothetical protein